MTAAAEYTQPADATERELAVTTFHANVVVTAGAGTGKTTLLVDRLVHLLVRNPRPLKITDIVALTFTNKAANEMKLRLRERLQSYIEVRLDRAPSDHHEADVQAEVRALIERYQLSKSDLDGRLQDALRNIERSEIGTIHSFAAMLLRLYPMESGVDPQFREDDGRQFERCFHEQWNLWLDEELMLEGSRADEWREALRHFSLDDVKQLAESICSETVDLRAQNDVTRDQQKPKALEDWLADLEARAAALAAGHREKRLNERLVRAAQTVIRAFRPSINALENDFAGAKSLLLLGRSISRNTRGWTEAEIAASQELVRTAKGLCQVDPGVTSLLWELLLPFAQRFRQYFVHEGFVSFDGLLIRACKLVRDHLRVREELKRQFQAILIDEFQDTDPVQYEILLYLAEQVGEQAREWRDVKLTPGKIFVVGDPKQSIYAFRRADIEAYLEVVEKMIKTQQGIECRLTTNFRSHTAILDVVNGVFQSLMQPKEGLQPSYIGIRSAQRKTASAGSEQNRKPLPRVLVRKIVAAEDSLNAERARRLEAESLARWLQEETLGKAVISNARGEESVVQPKDIAILFRKLTDIQDYLEPLRRRGIRYVVEGERHFYAVKEIIDTVNLLRAVGNPFDRLALVGVLRSPLGGLTDQTVYELHRADLLDYRKWARLDNKQFPPALQDLYQALDRLHNETRALPIGEAISRIYHALPLEPLAACYFHGEQAVANLEKLRLQAEQLGTEGLITLKEVVYQLERRVLDVKEEGESVLAEENLDAVRIMSIHKAKGLEFPIVVLAGCQMEIGARLTAAAEVSYDWSTGLTGVRIGSVCNLAGLYIAERSRLKAEEEQKRVLYVAMTRAREQLVLSCVPTTRRSSGSFLAMLEKPLNDSIGRAKDSESVPLGDGVVEIRVAKETLGAPGRRKAKPRRARKTPAWTAYTNTWVRRRERYDSLLKMPLFVSPTSLRRQEEEWIGGFNLTSEPFHPTAALVVGETAHRVLQHWDYAADTRSFADRLQPLLELWIPPDRRAERERMRDELVQIFSEFVSSKAYAELAESHILGREVPLLMPWDDQVMEGVIDVIYEHQGLLYLADFKTDRISREHLPQAAQRYRQQASVYLRAAQQSLGREVAAFKCIFLRLGASVKVELF